MTAVRTAPRVVTTGSGSQIDPLAGLGTMVRFVLRRNRTLLIAWPVAIIGMFAFVTAYYHDLLNTQQALDDFAAISNTASIKALTGLAANPATLGGAVWTSPESGPSASTSAVICPPSVGSAASSALSAVQPERIARYPPTTVKAIARLRTRSLRMGTISDQPNRSVQSVQVPGAEA